MLIAALVFYFSAPTAHHVWLFAQTPAGSPSVGALETVDEKGKNITCGGVDQAKDGVLLGRIVPCIAYTIGVATEKFSAEMVVLLGPVLMAYLAFVVTMFGVKILQGGQQDIHKEGFLLLLKIALVGLFLEFIPHQMVPAVYGIMADSQAIVSGAIGTTGMNCDIAKYQGPNTPLVWAQMDCVLGKLYGFTTGAVDPKTGEKSRNMFLAASMFGLLGGFFFGGAFGMAVFVAMVGVLISVFLLVMRTALAFLNGYLLVCLMLIISPIFLPLVLMRVTSNYFDPWWKNMLAGFLTPVLVTAFSMFALLLYDKMLFEKPDPNVPGSGALVNKLFDYDLIKNAQQMPASVCSRPIVNNPTQARPAGASFGAPMMQSISNPLLTAANDLCASLSLPVFQLRDAGFKDAKETFRRIFLDCVKLLILAFVINAGLAEVMQLIRQLTGTSSSQQLLNASTPLEQRINQAIKSAKDGALREIGTAQGADFVKQAIPAIGGAAQGFLGAIRR